MPLVKTLLFIAAVWELLRFAVLYLLFATQVTTGIGASVDHFITLWFGAPQLALAAGFLFMALYPERYAAFMNLLRLGKLLATAAAVPALAMQILAAIDGELVGAAFGTRMIAGLGVLAIDALLLIFLISLRNEEQVE